MALSLHFERLWNASSDQKEEENLSLNYFVREIFLQTLNIQIQKL